jgi:outer membrane biosynthesis protein TonB
MAVQDLLAAEPPCMMAREASRRGLLLVAAIPRYPYLARSHWHGGTGLFELTFDYETGHLREIHVVKSFGDRYLDGYSIGALKVWKAKPRSIHRLCVPIKFELSTKF